MISLRRSKTGHKGQSLLIIAAAIVSFLALTAVVVDSGNDYVQRRQLQNSMDAGSAAGALKVGMAGSTNGDVADAVTNYVTANGTDPTLVTAYYVVQDSSGNSIVVHTGAVPTYGRSNPVPKTLSVNGANDPVVGVEVEGTRTFNTYFAGVVGVRQLTVPGSSAAYVNQGVCASNNLFPLALNNTTFRDENGDGIRDVHYEQTEPSYTYQIFEKNSGAQTSPGNFGWLTWSADTSSSQLQTNVQNANSNASGLRQVNDQLAASSGVLPTSGGLKTNTQWYIDNNKMVIIPIFDTTTGSGASTTYHVIGFAKFHLTAMDTTSSPKSITGKFQSWESATGSGGCVNFGGSLPQSHPPIGTNSSRTLLGTVRIQKLTPLGTVSQNSSHTPVDVGLVLDISGSMSDNFGSSSKIQAAKNALINFTSNMSPTAGDQVGLVVFPLNNGSGYSNGASYNFSCTQNGSYTAYYFGQQLSTLTSNVASVNSIIAGLSVNGGTPTASGLSFGRQLVRGVNHKAGNVSVVILASDGLANIRLNGQWTGFSGNGADPACNSGADQDATQQANIAKADSNGDGTPDAIIYTIAVGTDFNPALLKSLATTDTDPTKPHYFTATDAASMASIYTQISSQVNSISGSCRLIETEAFAPNAVLSVKYPDGSTRNLTTSDSGEFVIPNAASGTYQVTGASTTINGVTYNIPTDGVGGPQISWPVNILADTASGTYKGEVALKASTTVTCGS